MPEPGREGAGALPTFVVIGAQKCGTTALHAYLSRHPEVGMSVQKELDFFVPRGWAHGVAWYAAQFDPRFPARGEASPNYSSYPHWNGVPDRMVSVIPDARLVYLVRDPLDRIAAHWVHNWSRRREVQPLAKAVRRRKSTYVERSCFMAQLDRYLPHYPPDRILVLDQADLRGRREATLERVFAFLGVDPGFRHAAFRQQVHQTAAKRRLSERGATVQAQLKRSERLTELVRRTPLARLERMFAREDISRPDVAAALTPATRELLSADADRLRAFTGQAFGSWAV